jgi:Uma2 family endonuclease
MTANPPIPRLITAKEFARMPDDGTIQELVRGRIVRMPPPIPYHGQICVEFVLALGEFVRSHGLGRIVANDSGVVTERDPDTVRGADVCYYSKARLPNELPHDQYADVVPDLVVEVRSPSDRWRKILAKVGEYLSAGVTVVIVADPTTSSVLVYRDEGSPQTFGPNDSLTIPDLLPGFSAPVARFFS